MENCIFCKIIKREIPANIIYEDERVLAFYDVDPKAPFHMLVIPKEHIESANAITEENASIVGYIFAVIAKIAKEQGFAEEGYRIVNNCGEKAGQTVHHMHFHVLARRDLGWPPG